MTAMVNNDSLLIEQRREFPMLLFSLSYPDVFHTVSVWMTITAPSWMGALNFVFFFPPPWDLMWQCKLFFFQERNRPCLGKKKGVKNQNGNDICHQRRAAAALPRPLMRLFTKWMICIANRQPVHRTLFTSGQAGRGHGSHTHPIRHSAPSDKTPQPPCLLGAAPPS